MWLQVFNANPYGTNCWLLSAEGSDDAVVVDPGFDILAWPSRPMIRLAVVSSACGSGKSGASAA